MYFCTVLMNLHIKYFLVNAPKSYQHSSGSLLFYFTVRMPNNKSGLSKERLLFKRIIPTGLYAYKVFGVLDNCLPAVLADVYMDLDYRKQWDDYVEELYEKECNGKTVVYWQVKYPYPMYYRDYVYVRQRRDLDMDGRKILVVLAQSTSVPQIPERSGVVRVNQYKQSLAIESDGKKGSRVFMYYFDNPGGQIPSWLINWVAKVRSWEGDCSGGQITRDP
uniref:Phosphatidylcholine transfer protein n=1 Tax=Ursus americanus TaxID=9643 RepID=A0A452QAB9_URSAM